VASPVRDTLEAYVAGRVKADHVVTAVVTAYYGERGMGKGAGLEPLIALIERASPGVVELTGTGDRPGFDVHLAARPFPREYESQLREAVEAVLSAAAMTHQQETRSRAETTFPLSRFPVPRLFSWFRSLFSPSP
jgi:hypothetical protein